MDMVAMIVEYDITSTTYDRSRYPNFSDLANSDLIPQSLRRLLDRIIITKSLVFKRRRIAFAQSVISAARPRSFISPILHESGKLIDMLSTFVFSDDYREVQRLYDAMLPNEQQVYDLSGDLVNFVFDNAEVNIRTLTGLGTWHAKGGTASVTPGGAEHSETEIPRSARIRSAAQIWEFAQFPTKKYRKSEVADLKRCVFGPLEFIFVHTSGQPREGITTTVALTFCLSLKWILHTHAHLLTAAALVTHSWLFDRFHPTSSPHSGMYGSAEGPPRGVENRNVPSHPDDLRLEAYLIRMT